MSKHCPTVESETMEQQSVEGIKSKVSRSAARHLRRKKLVAARREAEKTSETKFNIRECDIKLIEGVYNTMKVLLQKPPEMTIFVNALQCFLSANKEGVVVTKNLDESVSTDSSKLKMDSQKKSLEQIKAEREAIFKVAKAAAKAKEKAQDKPKPEVSLQSNKTEKPKTQEKETVGHISSKSEIISNPSPLSVKQSVTAKVSTENIIKLDDKQKLEDKKIPNGSKIEEKSKAELREQIKAEREAKKAAKAAAKAKGKAQDKPKPEASLQSNKTEKPKTQEKENAGHISSKSEIISNASPLSVKQSVTVKVSTEDKIKLDKQKLEDKKIPDGSKIEEKSKAELRAERRAKQEAQRAAKQALVNDKKKVVKPSSEKVVSKEKSPVSVSKEEPIKKAVIKSEVKDNLHEVNLFKHLYINRKNISQLINRSNAKIHPAILRLGVQYAEKVIVGSNARCVALLAAIKQLIRDYERPSQADFTRGLETSLQESISYLNFCRPSAVSMQNALKHLKWQMSTLPSTVPDEEAKSKLANAIDTYIQEQILLADKAISNAIQKKILNGDVILTYGFSSLIHKILCDAYTAGKKFRVVVVDGRPWLEGKELLRRLVKHGIDCSYILINALSFIMPQVSKVFLGAHAILANGAVMSRVGTAQVALIAKAFNVPVLVACETHKSCERVQTDSIVYNEIGDPDQLVKNTSNGSKKSCVSNWKSRKTLNLLNITYDVTPADLVTAVVTELAILPCTSVPVILRIKPSEM